MKTLYLVNTGYAERPVFDHDEWVARADFMAKLSDWQIVSKAYAMRAADSCEVLRIGYEQVRGYCKVVTTTIVQAGAASEYDKISHAMQLYSKKHMDKMALFASLLEHLASSNSA